MCAKNSLYSDQMRPVVSTCYPALGLARARVSSSCAPCLEEARVTAARLAARLRQRTDVVPQWWQVIAIYKQHVHSKAERELPRAGVPEPRSGPQGMHSTHSVLNPKPFLKGPRSCTWGWDVMLAEAGAAVQP